MHTTPLPNYVLTKPFKQAGYNNFLSHNGFTLTELLIALTLIASIGFLTVPSYQNTRENYLQNRAVGAMQQGLAQSEHLAATIGHDVAMCASSNGKSCSDDWSQGYIIFSGEKILWSHKHPKPEIIYITFNNGNKIIFRKKFLTPTNYGTFTIANVSGRTASYLLRINSVGRVWKC